MLSIKSKSEIELMKKACEIVATAHELIREAVRPGITTQELDRIAAGYIKRQNAIPSFLGVNAECRADRISRDDLRIGQ